MQAENRYEPFPPLSCQYLQWLCHGKTCLNIFVVVVPKEGLAGGGSANPSIGMTPPRQSFFWYDTNYRI